MRIQPLVPLGGMILAVGHALAGTPSPVTKATASPVAIIEQIQRADYEGDRAALKRLRGDLLPLAAESSSAARVFYWRGFGSWRRALNGFNEGADKTEIAGDLNEAIADFRAASARDAEFADAKAGEGSCLANLAFLNLKNPGRARALLGQSYTAVKEAVALAPDNPRVRWVQGANQWYGKPEQGGGQDAALATYMEALANTRKHKQRPADPLDPMWGEPELLMNIAFAKLYCAAPDPDAAERYAREALVLVPYWHYVRDILLPAVVKARNHQQPVN